MQAIIAVFPLPVRADVNGDGIGDLIVGAQNAAPSSAGKAMWSSQQNRLI